MKMFLIWVAHSIVANKKVMIHLVGVLLLSVNKENEKNRIFYLINMFV